MDESSAQPSSTERNLKHVVLKTVSSLMGLQLLSRLLTFSLNQALLHLATPAVYGTVSLQFELLLSTVLFLSREGVRNALLRTGTAVDIDRSHRTHKKDDDSDGVKYDFTRIANLALLPVIFGLPFTFATVVVYYYFVSSLTRAQDYFDIALTIYGVAAALELLSEPYHIRALQSLDSSLRVAAEGSGIFAKALVTVLILSYDSYARSGRLGLLAFAFGQLAYSVALLAMYRSKIGSNISFTLQKPKRSTVGIGLSSSSVRAEPPKSTSIVAIYFDEELMKILLAMSGQGVLKHILTEGDKFIMSRTSPLKDQGGYAVAFNYGSLVARIIFQPIEETSRLYFSRILSPSPSDIAIRTAFSSFTTLLLFYSHFIACILSFGQPYLPVIMRYALSKRYLYTSAPDILSAWVWYIPILAINGISEAFFSSVATPSDIKQQSRWMALFSVIYIGVTILLQRLTDLHDVAFVYANILNLSLRILYVGHFTVTYFKKNLFDRIKNDQSVSMLYRWSNLLPPKSVVFGFICIHLILRYSAESRDISVGTLKSGQLRTREMLNHSLLGITSGIIVLIFCWIFERKYINSLVNR